MAEIANGSLAAAGAEAEFLDLRDHPLPLCDGGSAYGDPRLLPVADTVKRADGILLASPIYNYDFNAAAKNLIELTGAACWAGKVVGFLAAAGGSSSYMSVLPIANSLMIDFRCVIIPRFVYADSRSFDPEGHLIKDSIRERIGRLCSDLVAFSEGLQDALSPERSPS